MAPADPRWSLLCRARIAHRPGSGFSDEDRARIVAHASRLGIAPIHAHEVMSIAARMGDGAGATPGELEKLARIPLRERARAGRPGVRVLVALLIWSLCVCVAMLLV